MKFSLAFIPLAMLASAVAAQGGYGGYQGNQGSGGYGQYQPYPQNYGGTQQPQGTSQWPNIPDYEVKDWQSCTNLLLNAWNDKVQGSGPACDMWNCLHDKASKYQRGGALTAISNALTPICGLNKVFNVVCSLTLRFRIFGLVKSGIDDE